MRGLYEDMRELILNDLQHLDATKLKPVSSVFFRTPYFPEDGDDAIGFHGKFFYEITAEDLIRYPFAFEQLTKTGFQYYLLAIIKITMELDEYKYFFLIENIFTNYLFERQQKITQNTFEKWLFSDKKQFDLVILWLTFYGESSTGNRFSKEIEMIKQINAWSA
jgi:hypothetical protein